MKRPVTCDHCGDTVWLETGHINRARKQGDGLYCNRVCAGMARRVNRSEEEQKELKQRYDAARRIELADKIKAKKAEYHRRNYDPAKAAQYRKNRMPSHIEYCRQPTYKAWKKSYDQQYRANKIYGEFAEVSIVLAELETEITTRALKQTLHELNDTVNKTIKRKREAHGYEQTDGTYSD